MQTAALAATALTWICFTPYAVGAQAEESETALNAWEDDLPLSDDVSRENVQDTTSLENPRLVEADTAYREGRYEAALQAYQQLYDESGAPSLLRRVGDCHIRLDYFEDGITALEHYLRLDPDANDRALTEDLIQEAVEALNEKERRIQEEAMLAAREAELEFEQELNRRLQAKVALQSVQEDKTVFERWWFWTIVGSVAISTGITALLLTSRDTQTSLPSGGLGTIDRR